MKLLLRVAATMISASLMLTACSGKPSTSADLNPEKPVAITIWHYYNGLQKIVFDDLVETFNQTEGEKTGVHVQAHSYGSITDLSGSIVAAFEHQVGSKEIPDIFSAYADVAYVIEQMNMLADLDAYFTKKELDAFVPSFIEEGRIGKNGQLRILPIAKSSEIFLMNKTDWEPFAEATGASFGDLATLEGVAKTAQRYYEWTDGLTPDIPNDGKAFYGRDAMANLFIAGSMQLGAPIFNVQDGRAQITLSKTVMRRIWKTYYIPYISGYFSSYGSFRSDGIRVGDILAYTGSTASSIYFPRSVESNDKIQAIEHIALPAPIFEGGVPYAVQQGAGMAVARTTAQREKASANFLKWFTKTENNLVFSASSGYMPGKKEAMNTEQLEQVAKDHHYNVSAVTYDTLSTSFHEVQNTKLYSVKPFTNSSRVRALLESNLSDKAMSDRLVVKERIANGQSLEASIADFTADTAFEAWYKDLDATLRRIASLQQ